LGSELSTAPYSGTWNTIGVANGTHTLLAVARDQANNRSTSTPITITVTNLTPDTTPPVTPPTSTTPPVTPPVITPPPPSGTSGGGGASSSGGGSSPVSPQGIFTPTVVQVPISTAGSGGTGTTTCPTFSSYPSLNPNHSTLNPLSSLLNPGSRNTNVTNLQNFLISQNLLSPDSATGFYGSLTTKAVQAFQLKYAITTVGTPGTTGYGVVGSKTRAKINQMIQDSRFMIQEEGTGTPLPQTVTGQANSNCVQPTMTREQLVAYIKAKIAELQQQLVVLLQELVKAKMAEMQK
jgi:hypothetical protein